MLIKPDFLNAIQVQFLKPLSEDDFVERGMKAWLVAVEWDAKMEAYALYFNFADFFDENLKYFKETYYANNRTAAVDPTGCRVLFTAIEAGQYSHRLKTYMSVPGDKPDDLLFSKTALAYLLTINEQT